MLAVIVISFAKMLRVTCAIASSSREWNATKDIETKIESLAGDLEGNLDRILIGNMWGRERGREDVF